MRLIDADVLKQDINNVSTHWLNEWSTLGVLAMVDKQPSCDAVPVCRCKDCELWNDWDSAGKESLGNYVCSCAHWSVEGGAVLYTRPTDYCSYGERKGWDE